MALINSNSDRLAANHHFNREAGSRIQIRRRNGRAISHAVEDKAKFVTPEQQATVAFLGTRGSVSLKLVEGPRAGFSAVRPIRGQPQARISRLAAQRDREPIEGSLTPAAHPAIGRSVLSPILLLGGSEL